MLIIGRILHELGGLLTKSQTSFHESCVSPVALAAIISALGANKITGKTAKQLLLMVFDGDVRDVETIIIQENLELQHLSDDEYAEMAQNIVEGNPAMAEKVRSGQTEKLQWFVGLMVRGGKGKVEAQRAAGVLRPYLGLG